MQGWLRLASDSLSNQQRFPPIPQENSGLRDVDMSLLSKKENMQIPNKLWKKGKIYTNRKFQKKRLILS